MSYSSLLALFWWTIYIEHVHVRPCPVIWFYEILINLTLPSSAFFKKRRLNWNGLKSEDINRVRPYFESKWEKKHKEKRINFSRLPACITAWWSFKLSIFGNTSPDSHKSHIVGLEWFDFSLPINNLLKLSHYNYKFAGILKRKRMKNINWRQYLYSKIIILPACSNQLSCDTITSSRIACLGE